MKLIDCEQGSQKWLQVRAGIPTASEFDRILTPTGKVSTQADGYMLSLLAERMMCRPLVEHVSFWMERGSEMEAEAVAFYEFQRDIKTERVGFMTNDKGTVGASPDRTVGSPGLLEIKCPSPGVHVGYLLRKPVSEKYYPQIQGQLWIAEREWVDILSYHPEMQAAIIRVERDDKYIAKLSAVVETFSEQLEAQYAEIEAQGWVNAPRETPKERTSIPHLPSLEELLKLAGTP